MKHPKSMEAARDGTGPAGRGGPCRGGAPRPLRVILGTLVGSALLVNSISAQGLLQGMRACLRGVPDLFGACDGDPASRCNLHYEIWSDVLSGEVNRDVTGEAGCTAPSPGAPLTCCTGISVAANYPASGRDPGKDWFVQWFGELSPGGPGRMGYYAAQSQIVDFGEFGNWNRFDCIGSFPIACFRPAGPPAPTGHPVTRENGTVEAPLGPLSPIPIPRAGLDSRNLLITLDWDPATGVVITDGAAEPITGYRVWVAEDTNWDQSFPSRVVSISGPWWTCRSPRFPRQ